MKNILFVNISHSDYRRIRQYGLSNLQDHLWWYLVREGLVDIPLSWQIEDLGIQMGLFALPILQKMTGWIVAQLGKIHERTNH